MARASSRRLPGNRWRRTASAISKSETIRLIAVLGVVAAVGYLGLQSNSSPPVIHVTQRGVEPADPLAGGQKVPLPAARALLTTYVTAWLPSTGPAGVDHVSAAWIDPTGQVALELDSRILFIYTPDTRTSDQFADAAAYEIELGEWEGTMIPLRGVRARAGEKSEERSASIAWLEGKALVEMYGDGGQPLQELISIAQNMRYGGI